MEIDLRNSIWRHEDIARSDRFFRSRHIEPRRCEIWPLLMVIDRVWGGQLHNLPTERSNMAIQHLGALPRQIKAARPKAVILSNVGTIVCENAGVCQSIKRKL